MRRSGCMNLDSHRADRLGGLDCKFETRGDTVAISTLETNGVLSCKTTRAVFGMCCTNFDGNRRAEGRLNATRGKPPPHKNRSH